MTTVRALAPELIRRVQTYAFDAQPGLWNTCHDAALLSHAAIPMATAHLPKRANKSDDIVYGLVWLNSLPFTTSRQIAEIRKACMLPVEVEPAIAATWILGHRLSGTLAELTRYPLSEPQHRLLCGFCCLQTGYIKSILGASGLAPPNLNVEAFASISVPTIEAMLDQVGHYLLEPVGPCSVNPLSRTGEFTVDRVDENTMTNIGLKAIKVFYEGGFPM